jgi:hypothetical protein
MPNLHPEQFGKYKVCMSCSEPIVPSPSFSVPYVGEYMHARVGTGITEDGDEERMLLPTSTGHMAGHYILPKKQENIYSPTRETLSTDEEHTFKKYD